MRMQLHCPSDLPFTKPYPMPIEANQFRCPCINIHPLDICRLPTHQGRLSHKGEARAEMREAGGGGGMALLREGAKGGRHWWGKFKQNIRREVLGPAGEVCSRWKILPGYFFRHWEGAGTAPGILCPSGYTACHGGCPNGLLAIGPLTEVEERSAQIRCPHTSETLLWKQNNQILHLRTALFSDRRTNQGTVSYPEAQTFMVGGRKTLFQGFKTDLEKFSHILNFCKVVSDTRWTLKAQHGTTITEWFLLSCQDHI